MKVIFDPFPLAEYRDQRDGRGRVVGGLSPRLADRLAVSMKVPNTSPARVLANCRMTLEDATREGHVALPRPQLRRQVNRRLGLAPSRLDAYLDHFARGGELVDDRDLVYLPELHGAELAVAERIGQRLEQRVLRVSVEPPAELDAEQRRAVRNAFERSMSIITGGPGRGKSHTVAAIARECARQGIPLLLMATTGRAAVRLVELVQRACEVDHVEAGTVHKVLGIWARRPPELPPGPGIAVIDEVSMLDLEVAAQAFRRLPRDFHLVLVGDADQLPSVGPGNVLGDLLASLSPDGVTRLVTNYRTERADLSDAIDQILAGQVPERSAHFHLYELDPRVFRDQIAIADLVTRGRNELAQRHGVDPLEEVLVVSPRSTPGEGLTTSAGNLNPELRRRANPLAADLGDREFAPGDLVVHVENSYSLYVMNGERGRVVDASKTRTERVLRVSYPDREVEYHDEEIDRFLRLAYVSSVHKAQGGEASCVLLLLRPSDGILLYRRLVYTGISRARQTAVVLSEAAAPVAGSSMTSLASPLARAVADQREDRRHGALAARLREVR